MASPAELNISGDALWSEFASQGVYPDNGLKLILKLSKFDNLVLLSKFTKADEKSIEKLMRTVLFKCKRVCDDSEMKESMYGVYEESPESFEFFGGQKKMLDCIIEGARKLYSRKRLSQVQSFSSPKQPRLEKSRQVMSDQSSSVSKEVSEPVSSMGGQLQPESSDLSVNSDQRNIEDSETEDLDQDSKLVRLGANLEGNVNRWLLHNVPEISPTGRYEVLACIRRDVFGKPQAKIKCIAVNCKFETTILMNQSKNWATSNLYRHFRTHARAKGNAEIQEYFMQADSSPLGRSKSKSVSNQVHHDDLEEERIDDVEALDSETNNNNDKSEAPQDFQKQ